MLSQPEFGPNGRCRVETLKVWKSVTLVMEVFTKCAVKPLPLGMGI